MLFYDIVWLAHFTFDRLEEPDILVQWDQFGFDCEAIKMVQYKRWSLCIVYYVETFRSLPAINV